MDIQEREQLYRRLQEKMGENKNALIGLEKLVRVLVMIFITLLFSIFYISVVNDIENNFIKISRVLLLPLFVFLTALNFLIKKKKQQIKTIDGKMYILLQ